MCYVNFLQRDRKPDPALPRCVTASASLGMTSRFFNPAFADLDFGVVGLFRLDRDAQMIRFDIMANFAALIFCRVEKQIDRGQITNGSLRIEIELAERFNFVAEKFRAHWQLCLPREKIENAAAHRELSARRHLCHTLVTCAGQGLNHAFHGLLRALSQRQRRRLQRTTLGRRLFKTGARCHDHMLCF